MRTILFTILLAFTTVAAASGPGDLDWRVRGALGINHTTSVGSGVATGSAVDGGLTMKTPGRTSVSAWSLNRTNVNSVSSVNRCGKCNGITLRTKSHGDSYSAGGATGVITPRIDPVNASFSSYGDGVAFSEFTRSFTLDVSGFKSFDGYNYQ